VRDIMTPTAYTVPHATSIRELARTMVTGRIHRLVVTHGERVVGIVTTLDLLKTLYSPPVPKPGTARRMSERVAR